MEQEYISQTALDQLVSNDRMQMLKASLPYLPAGSRRIVSLYTKIQELSNTLAVFSPFGQEMSVCAQAEPCSPADMLQDIRRFCSGDIRQRLDQLVNMMAMLQVLQFMKENPEKEGDSLDRRVEE